MAEIILEKAKAALAAAENRFRGRQAAQAAHAKEALEAKLANFDVYVESVMDSKRIKLITCKTDRKKKRIQDEMDYTRIHYKEVRNNMIKSAEGKLLAYKEPLYLKEARANLAAAQAAVDKLSVVN